MSNKKIMGFELNSLQLTPDSTGQDVSCIYESISLPKRPNVDSADKKTET
jgi:hypothetical protein